MKTTLTHDFVVQDHGSYHYIWSSSECNGMGIFFNSYPKEYHVTGNKISKHFQTYEEAKHFALSIIYKTNTEYIISQLNKGVEKLVSAAKYKMHLRIAEFRGSLFSQIQTLRS
ncbi:MAG: hypothetical protein EOO85_30600 [Pedobacter sp.]|nr:MAG: hypothetical protein EOO85_30600 [Pedobacter sp.]